ncbi:hypothetical protein BDZ89DRAFT_1128670 [Hymenopellis radicata]|nr:hypothetical protein BDZ89DRAFT_1128670 [Hymenopellis radicata]
MAYQQHGQYPPQDVVSGEQYRYALTNFRIAHEKVEEQRHQLEQQERQVAELRARISLLEGGSNLNHQRQPGKGTHLASIETLLTIPAQNSASQLDKLINRWASDIARNPPAPFEVICDAILRDIVGGGSDAVLGTSMHVQYLLRHAMSETISEGIINCLMVTNSSDANIQLTRIHEHLFARDPTVACVWRRQTFSAAVESCTPDMSLSILQEQVPHLMRVFNGVIPASGGVSILESAYDFSRMLHGSNTAGDAFYRAFVPEIGSTLYPRQIELVKRCLRSERGDLDRVGATIFPGLVKVTRGPALPDGPSAENVQTVVRRAQVICECAMNGTQNQPMSPPLHGRIASPNSSLSGY